ncbi:hypothetical protein HZC53_00875 [Candidatus Uhrbacteria bacterium]|nr:hypothetical protein [Candidatus Uhrbacteria bacterium]
MSKNTSLILGVGLAVVIVAGVGGYFLMTKKAGPETQSSQEASAPATTTEEAKKEPSNAFLGGAFKGVSSAGACQFDFDVNATITTFSGQASGESEGVTCKVTFDGKLDMIGNMTGKAVATYTVIAKGKQLDWHLEGPVEGRLNRDGGSLSISLEGIDNTCPANIPCDNPKDEITATLERK